MWEATVVGRSEGKKILTHFYLPPQNIGVGIVVFVVDQVTRSDDCCFRWQVLQKPEKRLFTKVDFAGGNVIKATAEITLAICFRLTDQGASERKG